MIVYGIMLVFVLLFSLVEDNNTETKQKKFYKDTVIWLIIIALAVPYIIRYGVGTDFGNYLRAYEKYGVQSFWQLWQMNDPLYYVCSWIVYRISGGSWYAWMTVVALVCYMPVLVFYRKFANSFSVCVLIYIMFMSYFVAYNGIRQGMAIPLALWGCCCLIEKKYYKYILCMLVAYLFHSSVIIFIPFSLLCLLRAGSLSSRIGKGILIVSAFFMASVWDTIIGFLGVLGQDKMVNDYTDVDLSTAASSGYLRLVVYLVPVVVMILAYRQIIATRPKHWIHMDKEKYANYWRNAVEYAAIFMFASTRYWIFSRMAVYLALFVPLTIDSFLQVIEPRQRKIFTMICLTLYFIYMYLMAHVESNLLPFKTEFGWIIY